MDKNTYRESGAVAERLSSVSGEGEGEGEGESVILCHVRWHDKRNRLKCSASTGTKGVRMKTSDERVADSV